MYDEYGLYSDVFPEEFYPDDIDESRDDSDMHEVEDDFYHATPNDEVLILEETGDVRSAAEIQNELESETETADTVEPYEAIQNDLKSWELSTLDDVDVNLDSDNELEDSYHELTIEEEFEKSIENMSLDELIAERNRLEHLSSMSDADIIDEYIQTSPNGSIDFVESLNKEELKFAKQQLEQGNTDMESLFGFRSDVEDDEEGYAKVLKR